jgi:hypothetical protein
MPHVNVEVHTVFSSFNAHAIPNLLKYITAINHPRLVNFPNTLYVIWPRYADSRCLPVDVKKQITDECLAVVEQYAGKHTPQVKNNISNLMSNLKTMNEEHRSQEQFINFNKKQDQFRSIKTENIIKWYKG